MSSCYITIMCHRCFNNQSICSAHCTHASIVLLYHQHISDHTYTQHLLVLLLLPIGGVLLLLLLFHCLFECLLLRSSIWFVSILLRHHLTYQSMYQHIRCCCRVSFTCNRHVCAIVGSLVTSRLNHPLVSVKFFNRPRDFCEFHES